MTKWLCVVVLLSACVGGRDDEGNDVLPKRGERATDPTIVSSTASCQPNAATTLDVAVRTMASDPGGITNLGTCATTIAGVTGEMTFSEGICNTVVKQPCMHGETFVVDVLVSNETGGFTRASVSLTAP